MKRDKRTKTIATKTIVIMGGILLIATIADLKFKGLLYQQLPQKTQRYVNHLVNSK